jgi:hypothetical protein
VLALVFAVLALIPLVPHLYIHIVLPLRVAVNPGSLRIVWRPAVTTERDKMKIARELIPLETLSSARL